MKPDTPSSTDSRKEIELLAQEVSELRNALRELSRQILRIERRIWSVLPRSKQSARPSLGKHSEEHFAVSVINRLTESAKEGREIENDLRQMTVKPELVKVARELGMTNTKLPPKDDLVRRISTRIRQKASLARGIR